MHSTSQIRGGPPLPGTLAAPTPPESSVTKLARGPAMIWAPVAGQRPGGQRPGCRAWRPDPKSAGSVEGQFRHGRFTRVRSGGMRECGRADRAASRLLQHPGFRDGARRAERAGGRHAAAGRVADRSVTAAVLCRSGRVHPPHRQPVLRPEQLPVGLAGAQPPGRPPADRVDRAPDPGRRRHPALQGRAVGEVRRQHRLRPAPPSRFRQPHAGRAHGGTPLDAGHHVHLPLRRR